MQHKLKHGNNNKHFFHLLYKLEYLIMLLLFFIEWLIISIYATKNNNKNLITPKGYCNEIKNYVKYLQDINPVAFLSNSFQLD